MGTGTRRRAAARRRRVHHRHHRRRHHHHHHRTNHVVTSVGLGLFAGRQHPRTQGNPATTVTTFSTTTSSSSTGGNTRQLPAWCGSVVVTVLLLTVSIVGFAVPAVPIPVAITSTFMFLLIIVVPLVTNVLRTRAARREGPVDDPEAPLPYTVTGGGGQTVFITEMSTVDEASSSNGPPGGVFNYDPPPSFNEAMEDPAPSAPPWLAGAPAQTPPGYPSTLGGTLQDPAYPPMGAPLNEEELPPPPSYDDVISGGATYIPQ